LETLPKFARVLRNLVLLGDDLSSGREVWQSKPQLLEYSTNNVCNLRCVMCAQHDGVPVIRSGKELSQRVLDEFLPDGILLQPMALSEPFAGDIGLYIEKCEQHDAFLNLISNATLFTEEKLRRVIPRVHKLFISIESHVPSVFEEIRVNAKFDKVVKNSRMALDIAREHNVPIVFVTIMMRQVYEGLPEYLRWCYELGGREVLVLELLETFPRYDDYRVHGVVPMERLVEVRDEALRVAAELGMNLSFNMPPPLEAYYSGLPAMPRITHAELAERFQTEIKRQYGHFCHHVATYLKVDPEGTVYPCCRAPEELKMGNANDSSLAEIWNGPKYRELRRRMQSGDLPDCCRDCTVLVGNPHYRRPDEPSPGERDLAG